MVAGAARLASVVHKKREQKKVEAVDFRQQSGKALFPVVRGLAQSVHVVDDEKSMLVDSVAMVRVADDERIDAVKFGNDQLEHAERVHGAQGMRGVRPKQDFTQA